MLICVVNQSTLCKTADVDRWVRACAKQAREHVAPAWEMTLPTVLRMDTLAQVPSWAPVVVILDDPDQANVLGYHTEAQNGRLYGRVFARPTLAARMPVSSVLSHEIVELLGDPWVDRWVQAPSGKQWALELCDPVESTLYTVDIGDGGPAVSVSDFVLPSFFDWMSPPSKRTSWCWLAGPFRVAPGGYAVLMDGARTSQIFGEEYPEWRRATKIDASRTARREASAHS